MVALGMALYGRWVFGLFSRLLEFEADLVGCREPGHDQAAQAALYKLGYVYGFDRQSWLHPPIRLRMRVLRAAGHRTAFRRRMLARTRRWKLAILAASVAAMVACL
jgi:Zn-dependent protease with chaperone function